MQALRDASKPGQGPQHHEICNTDNAAHAKCAAVTYPPSETPQGDTVYAPASATADTPPLHEVEDATGVTGDTQHPHRTRPKEVSSDGTRW